MVIIRNIIKSSLLIFRKDNIFMPVTVFNIFSIAPTGINGITTISGVSFDEIFLKLRLKIGVGVFTKNKVVIRISVQGMKLQIQNRVANIAIINNCGIGALNH